MTITPQPDALRLANSFDQMHAAADDRQRANLCRRIAGSLRAGTLTASDVRGVFSASAVEQAEQVERTRCGDIIREFGQFPTFASQALRAGWTVEQATEKAYKQGLKVKAAEATTPTTAKPQKTEPDFIDQIRESVRKRVASESVATTTETQATSFVEMVREAARKQATRPGPGSTGMAGVN